MPLKQWARNSFKRWSYDHDPAMRGLLRNYRATGFPLACNTPNSDAVLSVGFLNYKLNTDAFGSIRRGYSYVSTNYGHHDDGPCIWSLISSPSILNDAQQYRNFPIRRLVQRYLPFVNENLNKSGP